MTSLTRPSWAEGPRTPTCCRRALPVVVSALGPEHPLQPGAIDLGQLVADHLALGFGLVMQAIGDCRQHAFGVGVADEHHEAAPEALGVPPRRGVEGAHP